MTPLQRHQLAFPTDEGWCRVLAGAWDAQAHACLAHWAGQRLPLVVTRQRQPDSDGICLGLPAPATWDRRRLALSLPRTDISYFGAFPDAARLPRLLAPPWRAAWLGLCAALSACGAPARVYGSHGWQLLTGLDHLRAGSDIDLCIAVAGPEQADVVATLLHTWPAEGPWLDGELVFDDGAAVAWREWSAWRAQRTPALMVKRIDGVALARAPFWQMTETV